MSRVGRAPVEITKGVQVKIEGNKIVVKGGKGTLEQDFDSSVINFEVKDNQVIVSRLRESAPVKAKHGLYRALLANMIKGVSVGFEKSLQLVGVGYRAQKQGNKLI